MLTARDGAAGGEARPAGGERSVAVSFCRTCEATCGVLVEVAAFCNELIRRWSVVTQLLSAWDRVRAAFGKGECDDAMRHVGESVLSFTFA